jgi:hypothetical protein
MNRQRDYDLVLRLAGGLPGTALDLFVPPRPWVKPVNQLLVTERGVHAASACLRRRPPGKSYAIPGGTVEAG